MITCFMMYLSLFKDARGVLITCILSYFSTADLFYNDGFHCEINWSVGL